MHIRSIRMRIILWYVAILAAILVLLAGTTYFAMSRMLAERLDDTLDNRAFITLQFVSVGVDGEPILALPENDPNLDDVFQRVFNVNGDVVFDSSAAFGESPVEENTIDRALGGEEVRSTVGGGDHQARVLTVPIYDGGEIVGALQVANTTSDDEETLRTLLVIFAFAIPAALALATVGGWWLSTRALAPIDKITRAAQEISEHDLSRRLGMDNMPDDEVGRLARTFDGMIARLESAFERQRRFTSDASHELRTPLTAVRGQVEVALHQERSGEEYRRVLVDVNAQVDRMTRLSETLLMLARSDAAALPIEQERVDARDLTVSARDQVAAAARAKGLAVVVEDGPGATILGDEGLLLQMLLNLADNAVKYSNAGTVTIGWRTRGEWVEIFVIDTGPGIPASDRERVFERFYRGDASRASAGGLGLGLAIARSIAEAHGGTLALEDEESGGSTFVASLPAAPDSIPERT